MVWQDMVLGGTATSLAILGLASWLGKFWANRILEKDRAKYQTQMDTLLQDLRTRDSKELFVHSLQFEKEFAVYKDLWTSVVALARAGRHFRMPPSTPPKPQEEMMQDFSESYDALSSLVYENRPFYAPTVFDITKGVLDSAHQIARSDWWRSQIERKSKQSDEQADKLIDLDGKIEKNLDEMNVLVGSVSDAIRKRIWSTSERAWDRDA